jgi:hypothetical protein
MDRSFEFVAEGMKSNFVRARQETEYTELSDFLGRTVSHPKRIVDSTKSDLNYQTERCVPRSPEWKASLALEELSPSEVRKLSFGFRCTLRSEADKGNHAHAP